MNRAGARADELRLSENLDLILVSFKCVQLSRTLFGVDFFLDTIGDSCSHRRLSGSDRV